MERPEGVNNAEARSNCPVRGGKETLFCSHAAHGSTVNEALLPPTQTGSWSDHDVRSRHLRGQQRARVARRAARILQHYSTMQQEATAGALIHVQRQFARSDRGMSALSHVSAWCRSNTVGARGLDIPVFQHSAPGQFMHRMAEARGGMVTGPLWGSLKLPERHQDVMARERLARGIRKRPRETGDIDDAGHAAGSRDPSPDT